MCLSAICFIEVLMGWLLQAGDFQAILKPESMLSVLIFRGELQTQSTAGSVGNKHPNHDRVSALYTVINKTAAVKKKPDPHVS